MFLMSLRGNTYQRYFYKSSYEFLDIGLDEHQNQLTRSMLYILPIKEGTEEVTMCYMCEIHEKSNRNGQPRPNSVSWKPGRVVKICSQIDSHTPDKVR